MEGHPIGLTRWHGSRVELQRHGATLGLAFPQGESVGGKRVGPCLGLWLKDEYRLSWIVHFFVRVKVYPRNLIVSGQVSNIDVSLCAHTFRVVCIPDVVQEHAALSFYVRNLICPLMHTDAHTCTCASRA